MTRLKQFYPLLQRNVEVIIQDHTGTEILFRGTVRDIPDHFDNRAVEEFHMQPVGGIIFKVMPEPEFSGLDKGLWRDGTISVHGIVYEYWMKQYDEGSVYGIEGGRISKLTMKRDGKTVCNYDRGWDVKPNDPSAQLALDILLHTENY